MGHFPNSNSRHISTLFFIKWKRYTHGESDHTLFIKYNLVVKFTILIVYVDDIVLIGDDVQKWKD